MIAGLVTLGAGNYWISQLSLDVGPWHIVWPRVVLIAGLSMLFAPLNVAAFKNISVEMRGAAVGLLALLRNEGGSVGTSVAETIQKRRLQLHTLRLNEHLDSFNQNVADSLRQGHDFFLRRFGDDPQSHSLALGVVAKLRDRHALSLAYFDVFWVSAVVAVGLVPLVMLMKPAKAEKGAHIASE